MPGRGKRRGRRDVNGQVTCGGWDRGRTGAVTRALQASARDGATRSPTSRASLNAPSGWPSTMAESPAMRSGRSQRQISDVRVEEKPSRPRIGGPSVAACLREQRPWADGSRSPTSVREGRDDTPSPVFGPPEVRLVARLPSEPSGACGDRCPDGQRSGGEVDGYGRSRARSTRACGGGPGWGCACTGRGRVVVGRGRRTPDERAAVLRGWAVMGVAATIENGLVKPAVVDDRTRSGCRVASDARPRRRPPRCPRATPVRWPRSRSPLGAAFRGCEGGWRPAPSCSRPRTSTPAVTTCRMSSSER
jgi:hypothetical protein